MMKILISMLLILGATTLASLQVSAQEAMIGEVKLFAGNFAPRNWAFCEGQLLPINQNQSLFSILGTFYGGDGRTTFALPKLEPLPSVPEHGRSKTKQSSKLKYIICLQGIYPSRN